MPCRIVVEANLASTNREKQRVAARCVGDLVSKLGVETVAGTDGARVGVVCRH